MVLEAALVYLAHTAVSVSSPWEFHCCAPSHCLLCAHCAFHCQWTSRQGEDRRAMSSKPRLNKYIELIILTCSIHTEWMMIGFHFTAKFACHVSIIHVPAWLLYTARWAQYSYAQKTAMWTCALICYYLQKGAITLSTINFIINISNTDMVTIQPGHGFSLFDCKSYTCRASIV